MENSNIDINQFLDANSKSIKDYILLIGINLKTFIIISSIILFLAALYAFSSKDVYQSTITLKIIKQQDNILQPSTTYSGVNDLDRFVANEIETMKNYDTREIVAQSLINSFNTSENKNLFEFLTAGENKQVNEHKPINEIIEGLENIVSIEQKSGMDIVDITAESTSPFEAALIANIYANEYKNINLRINRDQIFSIRKFLEEQTSEKLLELNEVENVLKRFQEKGKIVALDAQATTLISQISQLDAQRDASKIDLMTSSEVLNRYKNDLKLINPKIVDYLENQTSQAYVDVLQRQIAELQVNRDVTLANKNSNLDVNEKTRKDYDQKIEELKQKLSVEINNIKSTAFATNPEHVQDLSQRIIEEEVRNHALEIRLKELENIINRYEVSFNQLPKKSIELAQYERKRESLKQVYLLVEEKYQEAMINELSQPGNIVTIGKERIPEKPVKPKRILIILIGLILGPAAAFGYILIKDYFDDKVKNPGDIEKKKINLLTWVPYVKNLENKSYKNHELGLITKHNSPESEAIRVLKSRIQFSEFNSSQNLKTILITSSTEKEGKTVIAFNLAASFAQSNKRTLLIDCDLRKPRVHLLMEVNKTPGLVDYLFYEASLDEIIRPSMMNNLFFIAAGSSSKNPDEVFKSNEMKKFLEQVRDKFDIIIIDSAPIIAVIDTEILSRIVDGTILVVSADRTEINLMTNSIDLIKNNGAPFLGTVLNNFKYKNGYGYYNKYYYNYGDSVKGEKIITRKPRIGRKFK